MPEIAGEGPGELPQFETPEHPIRDSVPQSLINDLDVTLTRFNEAVAASDAAIADAAAARAAVLQGVTVAQRALDLVSATLARVAQQHNATIAAAPAQPTRSVRETLTAFLPALLSANPQTRAAASGDLLRAILAKPGDA